MEPENHPRKKNKKSKSTQKLKKNKIHPKIPKKTKSDPKIQKKGNKTIFQVSFFLCRLALQLQEEYYNESSRKSFGSSPRGLWSSADLI